MSASVLLGSLPALAIIDATSIGTLVIPIMLLVAGRGRGTASRTATYLLVIGVFYWVLGAALLAGLLPLYRSLGHLLAGETARLVLAIVGGVLVAWSFWSDPKAIRKRGGDPEASARRWAVRARTAVESRRRLAMLAVAAGLIEAASMVPYLAAMGLITESGMGLASGLLVLAGYCAVMIAPGLALAGVRAAAGDRIDAWLDRAEAWATRSAASAFSWGIGIIGAVILVNTLPALLSAHAS